MLSVLISWPDGFDFPLFRQSIPVLKKNASQILICFTKHGNLNLREWLREELTRLGCQCVDGDSLQAESYGGDWRNQSTNYLLSLATQPTLLFLEQDFLMLNPDTFVNKCKSVMDMTNAVVTHDTTRFHPAFLMIDKALATKTERNFSAGGVGVDHFQYFTDNLGDLGINYLTLDQLGFTRGIDWDHMGGLTDNYFAPKPYYDLNNFYRYNDLCKKINCHKYWVKEMDRCSGAYTNNDGILYLI